MTRQEVLERFMHLNVWKRGGERAPHKPLLLLLALGRYSRGEPREIRYSQVDQQLTALLREFGPSRRSYHPEFPFYHLRNDGIWILRDAERLQKKKGGSSPKRSELLAHDSPGGLTPALFEALLNDRALLAEVATLLLETSFPQSMHEDILSAVGLDLTLGQTHTTPRDPRFRVAVLRAYEQRCAICGFDLRLGQTSLGLEAAHIRWRQAHGPDAPDNGLALCVLHHKLFDRGALTVSSEHDVLVSQDAVGHGRFEEYLLAFHGKPARGPITSEAMPKPAYLQWHQSQVFRAPARPL